MTFIEIIDESNKISQTQRNLIIDLITFAAKEENIDINNSELSVSFVDKKEIQSINYDYRGIDKPTDVISFALNETVEEELTIVGGDETNYLGDIVICLDIAIEQAEEYNHSLDRELGFLALHGFLHLLGYDHIVKEDEIKMFSRQDFILEKYGLLR